MKKAELLRRIEILERRVDNLSSAFTKARQCGNNVLAAVAGQPSVTVTATEALATAEHDVAGKLRELLGSMAPDYMRKIEVPVPCATGATTDKGMAVVSQNGEKIFYRAGSPPPSPLLAKVKECFPGISWFHDKNEVFTVADDGRMGIEVDYNGKFKAFLNNDRSNAEPLDTALALLGEHMNPPRRPRKVVAVEQPVVTSGEGRSR